MSMSPISIGIFLALAVALKVAVLLSIGVAAWRRAPRFPVAGTWRIRAVAGRSTDAGGLPSKEVPHVFQSLLDRHGSWIQILPSHHTVTVMSSGGSENYGAAQSPVERTLSGGLSVRASSSWLGDTLRLESDAGAAGRVIETYTADPDRRVLSSEVRVVVPGSGIDRTFVRTFESGVFA